MITSYSILNIDFIRITPDLYTNKNWNIKSMYRYGNIYNVCIFDMLYKCIEYVFCIL